VVVASANVVHAEQALQVIAAGITVVIDKPVGRNVRETHSIFDAADNAGVKACAFFNRRWDSDALTMKRVIKTREIGSIHRFESRFERFRPEINMDSWREDSAVEQGGGLLLDLQTHLIAGAIDLFGPAEVSYCSMRKIRGGNEDDCVIVLKHLMNVDSYLSVSAVAGGPGSRVRALGKTGAVEIDHLDPQEDLLKSGAKPVNGKWEIGPKSTGRIMRGDDVKDLEIEAGNYPAFYNQVAEAIKGNGDMPVPVADAMEVARLIDVAREMSIR
jgi:predicted dehydrogenase